MTSTNGLHDAPFEWPDEEEEDWIGPSPAAARAAGRQEQEASPEEQGSSTGTATAPAGVAGTGPHPDQADQRRFMCTDYGNGERLIHHHGRDLRYCHPWNQWVVWDRRRWQLDDTAEAERRAKRTVRGIYREAADEPDDDKRKRLAGWAADSESAGRIRAMLAMARSEPGVPVTPDALDADPWAFNVANGTLDLRTGKLRRHRRADLLTKLAPVAYDPHATAPTWLAFLDRIMDGDGELIGFLQRAAGYSLTGDTSEEVVFIPYGTGANGKSKFLGALADVLGDYAQQAPRDLLMSKPQTGIPNDVARLRGERFVTAIETKEGRSLDEELVKQLTGRDSISARFLHAEYFDFTPQCKLWLATNHRPRVKGTDRGIWRRLKLIPFTVEIPEDEQDKQLPDKLRAELPGILAWAVRGCLDWQQQGLGIPAAVTDATDAYRRDEDVLAQFIAECCVVGEKCWAYAADLYEAYSDYSGEHLTKTAFGRKLGERGFDKATAGHGNRAVWLGIGLPTTT